MNHNPIIDVEVYGFFNMKGASFVWDVFEDMVDVVWHYSNSIEAFLYSRWGELVVVVEAYGVEIEAIGTSIVGKFAGISGHGIIGQFCER